MGSSPEGEIATKAAERLLTVAQASLTVGVANMLVDCARQWPAYRWLLHCPLYVIFEALGLLYLRVSQLELDRAY